MTYVWFDALVNYHSFAAPGGQQVWPPDLQIIGKDILIPAHGVYWPIMLIALGLELPKHLLVHGFWTNSGAKISKSDAKSLVDPVPYIEKYGPDALRYFVLREMVLGQDADFSDERFEVRYTADLAKGLGNLTNRTLSMLSRYREGVVPSYDGFHLTELENGLRSDAVVDEYKKGGGGLRAAPRAAGDLEIRAAGRQVCRGNGAVSPGEGPDAGQAARCGAGAPGGERAAAFGAGGGGAAVHCDQDARAARAAARPAAAGGGALRQLPARPRDGEAGAALSAARGKGKAGAMNVTDVAPVRTDQPGFLFAIDALFVLAALFSFVRVSTYVVRQARQGTLVDSPRSPKIFPVDPVTGWIFTVCILGLVVLQSPFYYVLVPAGTWVFLALAKRSGEYQFGLGQIGLFYLLRWTLVVCGAVLFLELPLSHVIDRLMTWLQMDHPLQQSVTMFQKLERPGDIIVFILIASMIVPFIEELFFRGFFYSFLRRYLGVWPAIVLSAAVFAVAHANLGSGLQLWLLGVVLAAAYEHTGSLLLPMGIHGCFNFVTAVSLLVEKGSA